MRTSECFRLLADRYDDELVVCALGSATKEWHDLWREGDTSFHCHTMGLACSIGLGLAVALPETGVWVLDSDGGLAMNLGSILTEAAAAPPNLLHVVVDNGAYLTIDDDPLVNAGVTRFDGLARAAGIEHVWRFSDPGEFREALDDIVTTNGHRFVVLEVEPILAVRPSVSAEGPELKYRFGRYVESRGLAKVFGPQGY